MYGDHPDAKTARRARPRRVLSVFDRRSCSSVLRDSCFVVAGPGLRGLSYVLPSAFSQDGSDCRAAPPLPLAARRGSIRHRARPCQLAAPASLSRHSPGRGMRAFGESGGTTGEVASVSGPPGHGRPKTGPFLPAGLRQSQSYRRGRIELSAQHSAPALSSLPLGKARCSSGLHSLLPLSASSLSVPSLMPSFVTRVVSCICRPPVACARQCRGAGGSAGTLRRYDFRQG